ncbi:spore germination protein GerVB [Bacillus freudenreichii]|nr:spore germination protein GerVB [Bacillus freudenreichii]
MEQAKISPYQMFVLLLLFQLGSALLFPVGIEAKQNAWLALLIGSIGGILIFFIFYGLFLYYPNVLPTTYVQKLVGKWFGKILAFLYMVYFVYLAARVLRDFGEMLAVVGYPNTPLTINHALMIVAVAYTVHKGIEVFARAGEIFFVIIYLMAIIGFALVVLSNLIEFEKLKPFLEDGFWPVLKVAMTRTVFFPFGEVFAFAMIFPYVSNPKKVKSIGLIALGLSGINLSISAAINIGVLGVAEVSRTQFPLLATIQSIQLAEFLERLDIFFMLALIIIGFFKLGVYYYVAVIGTADVCNIKKPTRLVFPIGFLVLFFSIAVASNMEEHTEEGLKILPFYLQLPFQVIIPFILFVIAFFKNRKK